MSSLYSLAYLGAVMLALLVYARHYQVQKRKALQNTAQFYEYNFTKDIFEAISGNETRNTKLEKAALVAWASEDIARSFKMHESKTPLTALNQNGLIGDELFKRFLGTEVLLRQEVQGIAAKAESAQPGFAQTIMASAQQVAQNNALRKRLDQLELFEQEYKSFAGSA